MCYLSFAFVINVRLDQTLQACSSRAPTTTVPFRVATLGRPFGHTMRRALRYSGKVPRKSQGESRHHLPLQISTDSDDEMQVVRSSTYSPTSSSIISHLSGVFLELRSSASSLDKYSTSDYGSMSSSSTPAQFQRMDSDVQVQQTPISSPPESTNRQSQLVYEVHRVERHSKSDPHPPEVSILDSLPSSSPSSQEHN